MKNKRMILDIIMTVLLIVMMGYHLWSNLSMNGLASFCVYYLYCIIFGIENGIQHCLRVDIH